MSQSICCMDVPKTYSVRMSFNILCINVLKHILYGCPKTYTVLMSESILSQKNILYECSQNLICMDIPKLILFGYSQNIFCMDIPKTNSVWIFPKHILYECSLNLVCLDILIYSTYSLLMSQSII